VSGLVFFLYACYFIIIAYASLSQGTFKDMKKSYQFSLVMTLVVIAGFLALLTIQQYDLDNNETLYISFITLVNVYMWTVAYLYSPAVDSLQDIQYKEARREHEHIMNQFYEQELPDISGRSESTSSSRGNGVEKRRYMKRDKTEKAKEKLWESIIKETEDEASDDSSEDDERI
jgi:hypothetical protein